MAKNQSIKGARLGGLSGQSGMGQEPPRLIPHPREEVANPAKPRHVLDYVLAKRATLEQIKNDALARERICDADPYLIRAAKNHGEKSELNCPICTKSQLSLVTYVYGDDLGYLAGRVKNSNELPEMAFEYGHFRVYLVEVCTLCGWNHLQLSYVLGDGKPRNPPRQPRDVFK